MLMPVVRAFALPHYKVFDNLRQKISKRKIPSLPAT
jgi:hypothetical protein